MQQRISCKSETDSALMAQQRSWSCFLFVSYSSWSFLRCSLSLDHGGHFTRTHWSCDHGGSWSFGNFEVWSLIQPSTLRCNPSTFIADHLRKQTVARKKFKIPNPNFAVLRWNWGNWKTRWLRIVLEWWILEFYAQMWIRVWKMNERRNEKVYAKELNSRDQWMWLIEDIWNSEWFCKSWLAH